MEIAGASDLSERRALLAGRVGGLAATRPVPFIEPLAVRLMLFGSLRLLLTKNPAVVGITVADDRVPLGALRGDGVIGVVGLRALPVVGSKGGAGEQPEDGGSQVEFLHVVVSLLVSIRRPVFPAKNSSDDQQPNSEHYTDLT